VQLERDWFSEVVQLLAPPLPPTGGTKNGQYLLLYALQSLSASVLPVNAKNSLFVQVSFQVISGT
jgi:hypothetical protein